MEQSASAMPVITTLRIIPDSYLHGPAVRLRQVLLYGQTEVWLPLFLLHLEKSHT
jgi:hypothetical protein